MAEVSLHERTHLDSAVDDCVLGRRGAVDGFRRWFTGSGSERTRLFGLLRGAPCVRCTPCAP